MGGEPLKAEAARQFGSPAGAIDLDVVERKDA